MTGSGVCDVAAESRYATPVCGSTGKSAEAGATRLIPPPPLRSVHKAKPVTSRASAVTSAARQTRQNSCRRPDLLADPAVAALLELLHELGPALLDDPPVEHDVHELRLHQVQDALVVGDDQPAHAGLARDGVD